MQQCNCGGYENDHALDCPLYGKWRKRKKWIN